MKFLQSYPNEVKIFLAASLINSAGGSLMWPLTTMYVFDELGRSMADAGLVVMIQAFGGIIGQLLGGALYHRVGVKRLIVGSLGLCSLGLFALPFISSFWVLYMIMMGFIGLCNAVSMPAIQAFVGFRFADRRGELFNVIYVANNIGVALGTALSGFLADVSYHLTFILNGATSAVFALFFLNYLSQARQAGRPRAFGQKDQSRHGRKRPCPSRQYEALFVLGARLPVPVVRQLDLEHGGFAAYHFRRAAETGLRLFMDAERDPHFRGAAGHDLDQTVVRQRVVLADDGQRPVLFGGLRGHSDASELFRAPVCDGARHAGGNAHLPGRACVHLGSCA